MQPRDPHVHETHDASEGGMVCWQKMIVDYISSIFRKDKVTVKRILTRRLDERHVISSVVIPGCNPASDPFEICDDQMIEMSSRVKR